MKHLIQKIAIMLVLALCTFSTIEAGNDKPISFRDLPRQAQSTINKYFNKQKVTLYSQESSLLSKSYNVVFTNGDKIEFNKNGEWKEIDCNNRAVPTNLVPYQIKNYVSKNYRGSKIVKIERKKLTYEVELSSRIELTFDKKFNLLEVDY